MCGLGAVWRLQGGHRPIHIDTESIERRGPSGCHTIQLGPIDLTASVLHIRGDNPVLQPLTEQSCTLCWNGEIYDEHIEGNDTVFVLNRMLQERRPDYALKGLQGPFAFCFWDEEQQILWFGTDCFGRRSLIVSIDEDTVVVSSVRIPDRRNTVVPPLGIFSIDANGLIQLHSYDGTLSTPVENIGNIFAGVCSISRTSEDIDEYVALELFERALKEAVKKRIVSMDAPHKKYAVLFSGGIDSMVIAALVAECLGEGEIDLINVAVGRDPEFLRQVPDRQTGINGLLELRENYSSVDFRFIEVDLSVEDIEQSRERVESLILPEDTIMDFNIGTILWHAARGKGRVYMDDYALIESEYCRYADFKESDEKHDKSNAEPDHDNYIECETHAQILFVGLGADELLGGYGRHRTVFRKQGLDALDKELRMDFGRLWKRNLARDDRLISDHGREVRHPFLDEDFVRLVLGNLPISSICDLSETMGLGDKKILRRMARKIGLTHVSSLQKRAIQFGTRIANRKVKGHVQLTKDMNVADIVNPVHL